MAKRTEVDWPEETSSEHLISDALADRLSSHAPCPRCGARRTPGVRFCPSCGTDLNAERPGRQSWAVRLRPGEAAAQAEGQSADAGGSSLAGTRSEARFVVGEGLVALTGRQMLGLGVLVGAVAGGLATLLGR
jgi:hypothetical protein